MIAVLTEPKRSRHSALYLWFRRNHPHVAREFGANGVNWPDFARALGQAGLLDRDGKPPTPATAKQTWYRVCREVRARPAPDRPELPAIATDALDLADAVQLVPSSTPDQSAARPVPVISPAPVVTTRPVSAGHDLADAENDPLDRIRRIRAEMNARSGR